MTHQHSSPADKKQENPQSIDPEQQESGNQDDQESLTAGNYTAEIATNDGSVVETLDTAFHGKPGWSEGENPSGSNRADYYEARSTGKSDTEEEVEALKKEGNQKDGKHES